MLRVPRRSCELRVRALRPCPMQCIPHHETMTISMCSFAFVVGVLFGSRRHPHGPHVSSGFLWPTYVAACEACQQTVRRTCPICRATCTINDRKDPHTHTHKRPCPSLTHWRCVSCSFQWGRMAQGVYVRCHTTTMTTHNVPEYALGSCVTRFQGYPFGVAQVRPCSRFTFLPRPDE